MLRLTFIPLLIFTLGYSCSPCRHITSSKSDSLRIETRVREVIITDTVEITIPKEIEQVTVKCDSSSLSNKFARSKAAICPDGSLFHTLETIEQQIKEPIASSTQVRDSIIYVERKVNNIIEVERELTSWQSLQINGFWTLFALIIVLIISLRII